METTLTIAAPPYMAKSHTFAVTRPDPKWPLVTRVLGRGRYEALVEERSAATAIKRERPILVVLGNPPYNAYAGLSPDDEGDLVPLHSGFDRLRPSEP